MAAVTADDFRAAFTNLGWIVFPEMVAGRLLDRLARDLEVSYERCRSLQTQKGMAADTGGTAHHLLGQADSFLEVLRLEYPLDLINEHLGGKCVLNTYGGVINTPGQHAYVNRIHRDVRTFSPHLPLMVNVLVMLDPFRADNGATWVLSGSHRRPDRPEPDEFFAHATRLEGPRGSIAAWDSNLWHAAGENQSTQPRRALTLAFTRPFVKQQLDYPRLLGPDHPAAGDPRLRQWLGYNARVPSSLDEWYQPPASRFYQPDQE